MVALIVGFANWQEALEAAGLAGYSGIAASDEKQRS